jgi:SAM-dependent methyltransferase
MKQNGAWDQQEAQHHQHSDFLVTILYKYCKKGKSVIDFGCGTGYYVRKLKENGYLAYGFDGYKANDFVNDIDLTKPFALGVKGDVISLEVGEHIPKEFQEIYTQTVTSHVDKGCYLFFSWAEIGQPGIGHVNCREQSEVIKDIESRGFKYLKKETMQARKKFEQNVDWFQRTFLLFIKS